MATDNFLENLENLDPRRPAEAMIQRRRQFGRVLNDITNTILTETTDQITEPAPTGAPNLSVPILLSDEYIVEYINGLPVYIPPRPLSMLSEYFARMTCRRCGFEVSFSVPVPWIVLCDQCNYSNPVMNPDEHRFIRCGSCYGLKFVTNSVGLTTCQCGKWLIANRDIWNFKMRSFFISVFVLMLLTENPWIWLMINAVLLILHTVHVYTELTEEYDVEEDYGIDSTMR